MADGKDRLAFELASVKPKEPEQPGWEPRNVGDYRLEKLRAQVKLARETGDARLWMEVNAHLIAWDISRNDLGLQPGEPPHEALNAKPTASQKAAIEKVLDLLSRGLQIVRMAGPAGTGKTFSMRVLIEELTALGRTVVAAAPTWVASLRLQALTGVSAGTIHQLAKLVPITDAKGKLVGFDPGWQKADVSAGAVVVLDEGSMIDLGLLELLLDALPIGTQIVVVGDPCQLPPPKGVAAFNLGKAEAMLTEVMRQRDKAVGGVLDLVTWIREERKPIRSAALREWGVSTFNTTPQEFGQAIASGQVPIVICATNRSRAAINEATREALGYPPMSAGPALGERIILYSGARGAHIEAVNGSMGIVRGVKEAQIGKEAGWKVDVELDSGVEAMLRVPCGAWHPETGKPGDPSELMASVASGRNYFRRHNADLAETVCALQPAYTITGHKSQGSEWRGGVVLLEYLGWMSPEDQWRWGYTAVTRFSDWVQFSTLRKVGRIPRP